MKDKENGKPSTEADYSEYIRQLHADSLRYKKRNASMENLLFFIRFLSILLVALLAIFLVMVLIIHSFSPWKWLDENALQTAKQILQYLTTSGISIAIGRFRLIDRILSSQSYSDGESAPSIPPEE